MADPKPIERPISPFMLGQYYRFQMTSVSSILTRITGNALIGSFILGVWWLLAAAVGPDYFAVANWWLTSWLGDLIFTLSLLGIWYHYLAGLRHLYYDAGHGLDIETAEKLGWVIIIGSVVLTVLTLIIIQF
ncbi:succinate dehydrogenase, cytochrome b556 subunit [Acidimangrovimonas sediminis]|uniref:succinate dehydrogenase, cytochrome b556 subunit n=1 Tax=Acidimangrovimonas sediminis TaxID=2056283 RepID=UPI000C801A7D|nr:succinate dehydrogenase, cytochrome b556 subunit [Acidimangrovimonas sediminis]